MTRKQKIRKIKIVSNIPAPVQRTRRRSEWVDLLRKMKPGDSFTANRIDKNSAYMGFTRAQKMFGDFKGLTVLTRRIKGDLYRVWLVKNEGE